MSVTKTEAAVMMDEEQKSIEGGDVSALSPRRRTLEDLEGECLSGSYRIIRRIGKGGMGVVYLAQQMKLGRDVCVKVLNSDLIDNEDAVGRFQREARGLSRLHHPNIVTIFDYGRDGDLAYIVMEYAQGIPLSKMIKQTGAMPLDVFLPIAVQILKGIGEAHKLGLIHRDIKPANIMICELEGEKNYVKILDFGLAKLAKGDDDVTKEHQLVGSASYMSPEQILTGVSDTRTDVYALGVMFYLMLAGRKPFVGPNDNVILYKHVNETASPLFSLLNESQGVPEALCEVIDQCLQKDPNKRPSNAIDLLNAVSYALDAPQIRAGYSSMSLGRIDLQKLTEEAETHMYSPLPMENGASNGSGAGENSSRATEGTGDSDVRHNSSGSSGVSSPTLSSQTLSPDASLRANTPSLILHTAGDVSSVSCPTGLSLVQGGEAIPIQIVSAQSTRDRKYLLAGICVIAAVLAALLVLVVLSGKEQPQNTTPQIKVDGLAESFSAVEGYLVAKQYAEAENFLSIIQAQSDAKDVETAKRIVSYRMKIEAGREMLEADAALEAGRLDEALAIYERVLQKDPQNEAAKAGVDAVEKKSAERGRVVLDYDGDFNDLDLYIDDVYHGHPDAEIKLDAGIYAIRIVRDGYKDWTKKVQLSKSDVLTLEVDLEKKTAAKAVRKSSGKTENDGEDDLLLAPTKKPKGGKRQQGLLGI